MSLPDPSKRPERGPAPDQRRTDHAPLSSHGPIALVSKAFPRPPLVMFMSVEHEDEPPEFRLKLSSVESVRVRNILSACERIRALRPRAVVVGHDVELGGLTLLAVAAGRVGAEIHPLGVRANRALLECLEKALKRNATAPAKAP